jgi:hypothetical protein
MILFNSATAATVASTPIVGTAVYLFFGYPLTDYAAAMTTIYSLSLFLILIRDKVIRDPRHRDRKGDPKE